MRKITLVSADGASVRLFTSAKKLNKFMRKHDLPPLDGTPYGSVFDKLFDGQLLVYIDASQRGLELQTTLAHECVHAAVALLKAIGEDDPGEETVACTVGNLYRHIHKLMRATGKYKF